MAVAAAIVAGCATTTRVPAGGITFASADERFSVDGRFSARQGTNAVTAKFSWMHDPPRDELSVATPLGQSVAELRGDAMQKRVEVQTAEGCRDEASDWSTLTERTLGYRLPVEGLTAWIRAVPDPAMPY